MSVKINDKTGTVEVQLEEKDLMDAEHIANTMQTRGWTILMEYMAFARESLIEQIKASTRTKAKRELCPEKAATLKGFDEFIAIPSRIVERARAYQDSTLEDKKLQEDVDHVTGNE